MRCCVGRTVAIVLVLLTMNAGAAEAAPPERNVEASAFSPVTGLLREAIDDEYMPGALALICHEGEIVYRGAFGRRDLEDDAPMRTDTLIRIASMTKPVTSVAIMMLDERGRLDIDDPVSDYIAAFEGVRVLADTSDAEDGNGVTATPAEQPMTIRHLLTHTAGITYNFSADEPLRSQYRDAGIIDGMVPTDETLAAVIDRLAGQPLLFEPGTDYAYGLNTDVLGRVVEVAADQPLDRFMHEQIFQPLGMGETFFCVDEAERARLAGLYTPDEAAGLQRVGDEIVQINRFRFGPHYPTAEPCGYFSGGAGLVSTLDDYGRFLRMLLQGGELDGVRLLDEQTVEQMTRNQLLPEIEASPFGYGFGIAEDADAQAAAAGTYSWGGIFGTYFWNDPANEVVGIFMTQVYPLQAPSFYPRFQEAVYEALANHADD